jgi:hypothetical protein
LLSKQKAPVSPKKNLQEHFFENVNRVTSPSLPGHYIAATGLLHHLNAAQRLQWRSQVKHRRDISRKTVNLVKSLFR